ncbi:DUF4199 domain-containing protein [Pedobacter heparinus]|uniref:DUF4199 domain-containing protein n=1 Tax=Pedobacter heparinus (strain ATCC 13125 / DSM 2366 / CIP 104194 / JCM 7457 / NBRC 12017 / NCIMB 9290 / NRRL B-14731 / HIM 762-3) TaxID=485917 RepID=C6XYL2_PEDHD|nr:DUF4199 domain-containing protein [Pedobacter heparinus]ACU04494.1 hypothetical protein Phep_2290 [Pedobacter heparinus DSM 2366]
MKKTVWIFGLIIGGILAANMVAMVQMVYSGKFKGNDFVGYAALVVIFSIIFFGIRNYKNKQNAGLISFGKAFKIGTLIAFIGSTVYVVVWLFYYYLFVPDFMDVYTSCVLRESTPADLPAKTQQMADFKEMYKNPLFVVLITYSEVFPIGLIVALISGLILKKKVKTIK